MKRILIFSTAYHPFIGGAEVAVKEITDRIPSSEIEFDMITLNLDGTQLPVEKIGNITVYRIGSKGRIYKLFFPFIASRMATTMHLKKPYDAVWSIMASYSGFAALFFKKNNPSVPFILTLQEGDPIDYIRKQVALVSGWFKEIFTRADKIQTISTYLAEWAKSLGATAPITVIPNGVDLALFSKHVDEGELALVRVQLKKEPQDIFLVTTSRLVEKNAVSDVIKSLTHLPANVKFLIVGDGELKHDLEHITEAAGLTERVIFVGQKEYHELPKYLAISDIFIRPSISEGMGNSFIEAMAAGIPVIATPVGGIPDFLKDPSNSSGQVPTGLFCRVNDPASIAEQVEKFIESKELREKLVTNAKKLVEESYDWGHIAERMRKEILA
jgi:glycosyltransferase involved in cell wall biosynthesis